MVIIILQSLDGKTALQAAPVTVLAGGGGVQEGRSLRPALVLRIASYSVGSVCWAEQGCTLPA